jgi:hypothetical protein
MHHSWWSNPPRVGVPPAPAAKPSIDISKLTIWIRMASSIATVAARHGVSTAVKSSVASVADRVGPVVRADGVVVEAS